MQPFCGYNMADHWTHWLQIGSTLGARAPRIFRVNWFRKGADGRYLWPGYGENLRVLDWIVGRLENETGMIPSPAGLLPLPDDLTLEGLDLSDDNLRELLSVDPASWLSECDQIQQHFTRFGDRLPATLRNQLEQLRQQLTDATAQTWQAAPARPEPCTGPDATPPV